MGTRKKSYLIYALFALFILFITIVISQLNSSTEVSNNIIYPYKIVSIEDNGTEKSISLDNKKGYSFFAADSFGTVKLCYDTIYNVNEFYTIYISCDNMEYDTKAEATLLLDNASDINKERVFLPFKVTDISEDKGFKRIVKSDKEGRLKFDIVFSGIARLKISVKVEPLLNDNEYILISSKDNSVRMVFLSDDIGNSGLDSSDIDSWVNKYAAIRKEFLDLTGGREPFEGTTDYVLTENFKFFGLAGNPIYINQNYLANILEAINPDQTDNTDLSWELVHEMSHTFDGISGSNIDNIWDFDSEFFADLKMIYVLDKNGYYTEKALDDYLNTLKTMNTLDNGVYTSQGFTYKFISIIRNIDNNYIEHLKNMFKIMIDDYCKDAADDKLFSVFESAFYEEYKTPLSSYLTDNEYRTLKAKFVKPS